ncbi:MAG TPA: OmpA family protein [Bryobacteraceae bacterium]|jgi:outer membrane protein OmpA-like peptidoglycan-associated protein|nr:OmpA family protein [Bryobacteraceae bacterium]
MISGTLAMLGFWIAPAPAQVTVVRETQVEHMDKMPIYRVNVIARTTKAINYRHRSGSTKVDFQGTALMPRATGEAKVESHQGYLEVDAKFKNMQPATMYGPEYLTYVLWAVTPEGRPKNLGEVVLNGSTNSKLDVTTELQAFGLIVTAEPYYAVTMPSDVVVMENIIRTDTVGKFEEIDAKYELLPRGQYTLNVSPDILRKKAVADPKRPLEVLEARNAVQIAQWAGADKYAADTYQRAVQLLDDAENYQARKHPEKKPAAMIAREAVQTAEDARLITLKRMEEERLAKERQASADREAAAKAQADAEALRRQQAEQAQLQAQQAAAQAARDRADAEAARATAQADADRIRREAEVARAAAQAETERLKAESARERANLEAARAAAEAQRQAAQSDAERARLAADEANRLRAQSEQEKAAIKEQLRQQLNLVLETRSTARGLIVNMSDVLFDTAKYTLRPGAREKLSKIAGILLAHPGLRLEVEGHTDSVGGDEYNQHLSEQRAASVRDYLVQNGIASNNVTAVGFGKTRPVASNDTASGRQQNRRVELVVSGDEIGNNTTSSIR